MGNCSFVRLCPYQFSAGTILHSLGEYSVCVTVQPRIVIIFRSVQIYEDKISRQFIRNNVEVITIL